MKLPELPLLLHTLKAESKLGHKTSCLPSFVLENKGNTYACWELGVGGNQKDNVLMRDTEIGQNTEPIFL